MARVKKQIAAKDYPEFGIKKGDTYYRWALYRQKAKMSKEYPPRSELTSSSFLRTAYHLEDVTLAACQTPNDLEAMADEVSTLAGEAEDSFCNMPDSLQQGDTGQQLEARMDAAREWEDCIRSQASDIDLDQTPEEIAEAVERAKEEIGNSVPEWE